MPEIFWDGLSMTEDLGNNKLEKKRENYIFLFTKRKLDFEI